MNKPYPPREGHRSAALGYSSDMMHIAVNQDDPKGFMRFLKECGGPDVEVLVAGSIFNYAALHGATRCLDALFASGAKSDYSIEYWQEKAKKPSYGPKAAKQTIEQMAA